jgi:hypothetical protein
MPPRKKTTTADTPNPEYSAPKKTTGGNGLADQAWIREMLEDGSLHAVSPDDRPKGYHWDVMLQWDGEVEEVNPEFFEAFRRLSGKQKCGGTAYIRDERGGYVVDAEWNRLTRQCIALCARGANVCHAHGAKIPAVKAAAQRRLAEAAEIVAMRLIGLTASEDENNVRVDHKDRISASNSVLDRAGIKGGVDIEITTPGYKKVLESMFGEAEDDDDA